MRPTIDELEQMLEDGSCETTDDCEGIELDGFCEHGCPSWPMALGWL